MSTETTTPRVAVNDGSMPKVAGRFLTDHRITQLEWWSGTFDVVSPPTGSGPAASLTLAVRTVWKSMGYDLFLSANVRNAMVLGLFKRLTGRHRPVLMMTEMRLDDPRPGLRWRLKVLVQRYAYAAADVMCVSSRREAELYAGRLRVPLERFRFVPWHTNVLEPRFERAVEPYLFAAGRTGRDWTTFAEAVRGLDVPVTVVCSAGDAAKVDFAENVTVLTDIPYPRYRALLEGATAVVVPLEQHSYSSGQVVILEAMALGKAVVAARVLGTEDYIDDGVDGILVEPGNAASLRCALNKVATSQEFADQLGRSALAKVLKMHTLAQYARRLVEIANDQVTSTLPPALGDRR